MQCIDWIELSRLRAGYIPKIKPIAMEKAKDIMIVGTDTIVLIPDTIPITFEAPIPKAIPIKPPINLLQQLLLRIV